MGWHIPSDCEFMYLEHGLGMTIADQNLTNTRGSGTVGTQLKTAGTSGFNFPVNGYRGTNGLFTTAGAQGFVWTSTSAGDSRIRRNFLSTSAGVNRLTAAPAHGYSVRCLKDN